MSKRISSITYIAFQAEKAAEEGPVSAKLADLFFQCAQDGTLRTLEEWDELVVDAVEAESTIAEAIEYREDPE